MASLLKNEYNATFINKVVTAISAEYPSFDQQGFVNAVFDSNWEARELKDRMHHIAEQLHTFLPDNYKEAIAILKPVSLQFSGLTHMVFPDFVELFGIDDYDTSIDALAFFTSNSSSEFAIRPFIIRYPTKAMAQMEAWTQSDNEHIRRLASEGCRPRLPWAMALPAFKKDPSEVIRVISHLKNDPSLYVRRSVANNLNDIVKDNPAIVKKIAKEWLGQTADTDWLVKHACRTLLKQGDTDILTLFGFQAPEHITIQDIKHDTTVKWSGQFDFSFALTTTQKQLGKLRLEFAIDFMKSNGKQAAKVFQISEGMVTSSHKSVEKYFSFRPISTRKYYAGMHRLRLMVNGVEMYCGEFELRQS